MLIDEKDWKKKNQLNVVIASEIALPRVNHVEEWFAEVINALG